MTASRICFRRTCEIHVLNFNCPKKHIGCCSFSRLTICDSPNYAHNNYYYLSPANLDPRYLNVLEGLTIFYVSPCIPIFRQFCPLHLRLLLIFSHQSSIARLLPSRFLSICSLFWQCMGRCHLKRLQYVHTLLAHPAPRYICNPSAMALYHTPSRNL